MTREEAIEILTMLICQDTRVEADDYEQALEMAIKALSQEPIKYWIDHNGHVIPIQQPSVTQKSGKWIRTPLLTCDRCNKINKSGEKTDYCPNCGARMESEDKE